MESGNFHVVIPARYASSRLEGKVLVDIGGRSMLAHVYNRAVLSGAESVTIAVDDERVEAEAKSLGADVIMTDPDHQTGTERVVEAVEALDLDDDDVVINVQADEPMIDPATIKKLGAHLLEHENVSVATLSEKIASVDDLFDPSVVKVVLTKRNFAMYFSRSPIPWDVKTFADKSKIDLENYRRHIGLYGFRVKFLRTFLDMASAPIANIESLEQLRILYNGGRIQVIEAGSNKFSISVDTPSDLQQVRDYFEKNGDPYSD